MTTVMLNELPESVQQAVAQIGAGEKIVLLDGDSQPVAEIVAPAKVGTGFTMGRFKGKVHLAPDFDAPLADFASYEQ